MQSFEMSRNRTPGILYGTPCRPATLPPQCTQHRSAIILDISYRGCDAIILRGSGDTPRRTWALFPSRFSVFRRRVSHHTREAPSRAQPRRHRAEESSPALDTARRPRLNACDDDAPNRGRGAPDRCPPPCNLRWRRDRPLRQSRGAPSRGAPASSRRVAAPPWARAPPRWAPP